MGPLYVVATPIGNLEDLSPRALRLLREADLIAAEDTRRTRKLLTHFGIKTPLTSYFEHNKLTKLETILSALQTGSVALVSDGGMPGIADPGYELVRAAIAAGRQVTPVPGPSAIAAALVASGLPTDAFVFLGFLPRKSAARRRYLAENAADARTLVAFEAPHRLLAALEDVEAEFGDRPLAVARELTKVHEEVFRGNARAAREHFSQAPVRGEITLVIGGAMTGPAGERESAWSEAQVRRALSAALQDGESPAQAAHTVAQASGWPRRKVYRMAIERNDPDMLLDDPDRYTHLDALGMGDHIDGLPNQIETAWLHAQAQALPPVEMVSNVVICGMGGSAIGGSLLQSLLSQECSAPILSVRDYDLPAFVGPDSLVIGSSHSGNTEETLTAFRSAHERGAVLVGLSTGGELARLAAEFGGTHWLFEYNSQPRAAIGYSLMLPLALLSRLGLVRDYADDVTDAVRVLRSRQSALRRDVPLADNPAKRLAGQLMERNVLLFAAEPLVPVARRWRGQLAENAKAWAQYEALPEMNHNAVAGVEQPEALLDKTMALFFQAAQTHPRNQARLDLTRELFMTCGYNTDVVQATGETRLAQMMSALHFGDYVSYYLAIAYGVDPTPIETIAWFKEQLAQ